MRTVRVDIKVSFEVEVHDDTEVKQIAGDLRKSVQEIVSEGHDFTSDELRGQCTVTGEKVVDWNSWETTPKPERGGRIAA